MDTLPHDAALMSTLGLDVTWSHNETFLMFASEELLEATRAPPCPVAPPPTPPTTPPLDSPGDVHAWPPICVRQAISHLRTIGCGRQTRSASRSWA